MNQRQQKFLDRVAKRVPVLLASIAEGNDESLFILGTKRVRGREVRLILKAEVVDPGGNPMATHSSARGGG